MGWEGRRGTNSSSFPTLIPYTPYLTYISCGAGTWFPPQLALKRLTFPITFIYNEMEEKFSGLRPQFFGNQPKN